MKLAVHFSAHYGYEERASFSPHIARILPRRDLFVKPSNVDFRTDTTADVQYRLDLFDNLIAYCFFPEMLTDLDFQLRLELEIQPKNPFHFLLEARASNIPIQYSDDESLVLSPYLASALDPAILPPPLKPEKSRPTIEALMTMAMWLHENMTYERRDEGAAYATTQTLEGGRGSCRDFSVAFADVLRVNGVAARLVSGYLWENDDPDSPRRAENAMHAWTEAFLPGAGWVGIDPTNGVFCDHHFIPTAVGITPEQISPISGNYYGEKVIKSTMESSLSISEIKS